MLPLVAYALPVSAAIGARHHAAGALFAVAGAALLLLFIGVHNAGQRDLRRAPSSQAAERIGG